MKEPKFNILLITIILSLASLNIFAQEYQFDDVSYGDIISTTLTSDKINRSDNSYNTMPAGTILVYKTNDDRYGKIQITESGQYLKIKFKTYLKSDMIYNEGELTCRESHKYDLDKHPSDADFGFQKIDPDRKYFVPQNGAVFAVYDPAFTAIRRADVRNLDYNKINANDNETNQIPSGTIITYQTNEGRLGKLKIVEYGYNLRLKWKTYNNDGTVFSEGGNLLITARKSYDLDIGNEENASSDFGWEYINHIEKSFTPRNGAKFRVFDPAFDKISLADMKSANLSAETIIGYTNNLNQIPTNTYMVYKTDQGRYGKLKIVKYGTGLKLKWKTFNNDRTIFSQGGNLVVNLFQHCDLDLGTVSNESSDLNWKYLAMSFLREFEPENGAEFNVYAPCFDDLSLSEIKSTSLSPNDINGSNDESNQMPVGTVLAYQTDNGRFGKLKIVECGFNLKLKWKTYKSDGSVFSEGGNLTIRGTWSCDLDAGKESDESSDFLWEQLSLIQRYLSPENGAKFTASITDIKDKIIRIQSPNSICLYQNYPNPFNPTTTISYQLPVSNNVELAVYNMLGQKVSVLVNRRQQAGFHKIEWSGSAFASGVYFYKLITDQGYVQTKKLILIK